MRGTVALVLAATLGSAAGAADSWTDDYGAALKQARRQSRPMLIVIEDKGQQQGQIRQVSHTADGLQASLLEPYVLERVDVNTEYGRRVADAFKADTSPTTVITDKGARQITFAKAGSFSDADWAATLARYRNGERPAPAPAAWSQPGYQYSPQPTRRLRT